MNFREQFVKRKWEANGWKVIRNGAPDFIAIKVDQETGSFTEIAAIEVKAGRSRLTIQQQVWKRILEAAGVRFVLERVQ